MKPASLLLAVFVGGCVGLTLGSRLHRPAPAPEPQVPQAVAVSSEAGVLSRGAPVQADYQEVNFSQLLAEDPAQACHLAVETSIRFEEAVAHWTSRDPRAAADYVQALENDALRERGLGRVASSWAVADPEAVTRWFFELTEADRVLVVRGLKGQANLFSLLQSTTLLGLLPASLHHFWLSEVISSRFSQDLPSLVEWAQASVNPVRAVAIRILLPQWAEQDALAAARFVDEHDGDINFDTRRRVALNWGRTDPLAAFRWVEKIPDASERGVAMGNVLESYAQVAPEKAAALIGGLPESFQKDATETVLAQWAKISPSNAAAWLAQLPAGPVADRGVALVAKAWARNDPVGAAGFLETLSPGIVRDKVIGEFTQDIDGYDIQGAVQWSLRIQDENERERRFGNALARWLDTDRPAAEQWITQSGFGYASIKNALRHAGR